MVKMKYNTISASSLNSEGKKSSFTIYADMDLPNNKMASTEADIASIRDELHTVEKALKLQTRRCRQLVAEYTKRLQQKEAQYQSEKTLRDDQLAKVLRALIIFEARLKQEQKFIAHQLKEKDYLIHKQHNEIKKLTALNHCKNCNQYYSSASPNLESADSSSEYVVTDYQSSNFGSLDSSSSIYATLSEKSYSIAPPKPDTERIYQKNKTGKDSLGRRGKKFPHRKSVGTYFEVLKLRNDSPSSNTSNDYEQLDSLPAEINAAPERIFEKNDSKITDSIPVFEGDAENNNDNWYASASDQEDDEQRDIYRNNPVLECMNQILLQNINDSLNSPPKTPNSERKSLKKVKFSDEEEAPLLTKENVKKTTHDGHDYYETPIQKAPNFYETPQSIYSNDYEQILSKCSETFTNTTTNTETTTTESKSHVYVDLDSKSSDNEATVRKLKILRTPPALPPKPTNLVLKYKHPKVSKEETVESESDYCSISELNLPTNKATKISVVAEIHPPLDVIKKRSVKQQEPDYDPVVVNDGIPPLLVKKCVEKLNIQLAKKTEEIPKLPQVSEILIPEEGEEKEERISQDNYVKNNSQILGMVKGSQRRSIVMGTSVSNLITGFNNQQLISEFGKKKRAFAGFEGGDKAGEEAGGFDLSQNFEEFKLDECELEEYDVSEMPEEEAAKTRVELVRATNDALAPSSVELLKRQLEKQKASGEQEKVAEPTYEHFLECTGLSSKSILTPSRLLSNHKSMLKPKDIKLRSKVRASGVFERHSGGALPFNTVKYWTEPYI